MVRIITTTTTSCRKRPLVRHLSIDGIRLCAVFVFSLVSSTIVTAQDDNQDLVGVSRNDGESLPQYIKYENHSYSFTNLREITHKEPTSAPTKQPQNIIASEGSDNETKVQRGRFPMCPLECQEGYVLPEDSVLKLPTVEVPCANIFLAAKYGYLSTSNCNFIFELLDTQRTCQCVPENPTKTTTIDDLSKTDTSTKTNTTKPNNDKEDDDGVEAIVSTAPSPVSDETLPHPKCPICRYEPDTSIVKGAVLLEGSVILPNANKTNIPCYEAASAGAVGLISLRNCVYLNKLMTAQNVCGCIASDNSDAPSDVPSTYPTGTPSTVPSLEIDYQQPHLQRSEPRDIQPIWESRFKWLFLFTNSSG